jgi:hypothetical protein
VKVIKRYSWGFKGLRQIEVSILSTGPESVGEIKVSGQNLRAEEVRLLILKGYDLDGHLMGSYATPAMLQPFILAHLKGFRPYATHRHTIPTPEREELPGFVT